jgi:DNA invertase Pin-like site-specific DNA recombinase
VKVYGYARVSTEEQADGGRSLEVQRSKVRLYAELHDLELVDVVEDAGFSAKDLRRPGIRRVLDALDRGDVQGVVIVKLDRLTRSLRDWSHLVERRFSDKGGAVLLSVEDSIDTRTASGRMVLNLMVTVAQWEREAVGERTRAVLQHKQAKGEHVGRPARGLRIVDQRLQVDPGSVGLSVYRRARELRTEGRTYRDCADALNAEGYRPERGRAFWASTVRLLLSNPRLAAAAAA